MSVIEAPSGRVGLAVRSGRHDPVLSTKLAPPSLPGDVLPRRRLLDLLRAGAAGPVTLVSAPAGSGKTTLVAAWTAAEEVPGTLTWVTLEQGDEQPGRFWSSVVEGLRRGGVAGLPGRPLVSEDGPDRSMLLRIAARLDAHERPVTLVLDNADRLPDPVLWQEIDDLLVHIGDSLHLVLLTRRDPALPLPQLRLAGALTEIRMADLAFTGHEARTFLERSGIHLEPRDVDALMERTGGWPAGIRFAAMSLVGRSDLARAVAQFGGAEGNVAEYLFTEVLDQKPPELREVLLRSSVVDVLWPGLLEALTGAPEGRTLDFVARGNAFLLPVPGTTGCYRYQPLFRDLLRAQLAYEQPALVPELHRAAARWLADHDELLAATRHAVAGGDWAAAAGFVVDDLAVGRLLAGAADEDLQVTLRGMPDSERGTAAALVRTALALHDGDLPAGLRQLDAARAGLADKPTQRARSARVVVAALGALVAERDAGLEDALRAARQADRLLAASGARGAGLELWAAVALCRGRLLIRQGDVGLARAVLAEVVEVAGRAGRGDLSAEALGLGALLEAVSGHLRRAVELVRTGADADAGEHRDDSLPARSVPAAVVALAWVHLERFELRAAREMVCRAELLTNRSYDPVTATALATLQARLRNLHHGAAADPLETNWRSAVAGLVRQADRAARRGDLERARRILAQALDQAAPEHLRRPFLQAPAPVQELVRPGTALAAGHPWLYPTTPSPTMHPVTVPATRDGSPDGGLVVEPLTPKEQEVLGHLGDLLTTEEIAAAMFVSVNTVRTHVRSVLRKLAVTRRHEAVRRAWELGLLQRSDAG
jgi:LuxR family maltose regulon positive regulatory protein